MKIDRSIGGTDAQIPKTESKPEHVYAKTREECEEKLAELIKQMKKEFKK